MIIDILTLFPDFFQIPLNTSILKRAQTKKLVFLNIHNLRNYTTDKHHSVDDKPYGGGPGMILKPQPIYLALKDLKKKKTKSTHTILLTPKGKTYTQKKAQSLSKKDHLILISGHYEGFDHRITNYVDDQISIGNYILTGGEIPALILIDSIVRLIPNVINKQSLQNESFSTHPHALEYPQYTRPPIFKGKSVPKILLSGDHQKITAWQKKMTKIQKI